MRIVHYLAQVYCVLLAVNQTFIYFSQVPESELERVKLDLHIAGSNEPTIIPLLLSTLSIGLILSWFYAQLRKKEGIKTMLMGLTFVLAITVYWFENPLN